MTLSKEVIQKLKISEVIAKVRSRNYLEAEKVLVAQLDELKAEHRATVYGDIK